MSDISDLDKLVADNVREFEITEIRRRKLSEVEREAMLDETLGPKTEPQNGERFVVGDPVAGITSKSVWFQFRRIHFATIVSIAVGEVRSDDNFYYCIDLNCTLRRSYRISVPTIPEADSFVVGLSQFMSLNIVATVEEEFRNQQRAEEEAAANEANIERRQRRSELLAARQNQLLRELIQVECAPRISFGMIC
jgi:hypothetical protein